MESLAQNCHVNTVFVYSGLTKKLRPCYRYGQWPYGSEALQRRVLSSSSVS
jgi:hypothetical protein